MQTATHFLKDYYADKMIYSIIEYAINQPIEIYFLNQITGVPQPLTWVQLAGVKKFTGITILLETGQTYQMGLIMEPTGRGSYQTVGLADLFVDENTLNKIKKELS